MNTYCRVASACRYRWGLSNAWDQFYQISLECTSISSENKTKFDDWVLPFHLYPPTLYITNLHLLCNHWFPRGLFYFDPPSWFLRFKKLWKIHTCLFHPFHPAIKHRRVNLNWEEPIMNPMLWFFRSFDWILVHSSKYTLLKLMLGYHLVTIYKRHLVKVLSFSSLLPFTKKIFSMFSTFSIFHLIQCFSRKILFKTF